MKRPFFGNFLKMRPNLGGRQDAAAAFLMHSDRDVGFLQVESASRRNEKHNTCNRGASRGRAAGTAPRESFSSRRAGIIL